MKHNVLQFTFLLLCLLTAVQSLGAQPFEHTLPEGDEEENFEYAFHQETEELENLVIPENPEVPREIENPENARERVQDPETKQQIYFLESKVEFMKKQVYDIKRRINALETENRFQDEKIRQLDRAIDDIKRRDLR